MKILLPLLSFAQTVVSTAQPVLSTGPNMPKVWIDQDTKHKIIRLTNNNRSNLSFYFHNNPFVGNKMVYYSTNKSKDHATKQETFNSNASDRQLYSLDLTTLATERLTNHDAPMQGEIVSAKLNEAFYQIKDSVFAVNISTKKERLVYVFPEDFKAGITTINADGTLLAGAKSSEEEKEIFKSNPQKNSYFNLIYEAKLPRTLFTINIKP